MIYYFRSLFVGSRNHLTDTYTHLDFLCLRFQLEIGVVERTEEVRRVAHNRDHVASNASVGPERRRRVCKETELCIMQPFGEWLRNL